jgi:hypothetical protein
MLTTEGPTFFATALKLSEVFLSWEVPASPFVSGNLVSADAGLSKRLCEEWDENR